MNLPEEFNRIYERLGIPGYAAWTDEFNRHVVDVLNAIIDRLPPKPGDTWIRYDQLKPPAAEPGEYLVGVQTSRGVFEGVSVCQWDGSRFWNRENYVYFEPTYWMRIPPLPDPKSKP